MEVSKVRQKREKSKVAAWAQDWQGWCLWSM